MIVQKEMVVCRNDEAIVESLQTKARTMAQENAGLQANQNNHNGGIDEFHGLRKFQRRNMSTFKGGYDSEGAQTWLREIGKILWVMAFTDAQKVLFGTHMLSEEVEYQWDNACQRMKVESIEVTWTMFGTKFLEKYLPGDVHSKKEIKFHELKQGNMTVVEYVAKFEELVKFCQHYNGAEVEG